MGKLISLPTGEYSAKQLFTDLHDDVHDGTIEELIVLYRPKDQGYSLTFSHMSDEELIFILTLVKQELVNRTLYGVDDGE